MKSQQGKASVVVAKMIFPRARIINTIHKTLILLLGCFAQHISATTIEPEPIAVIASDTVNEWQHILADPSKNDRYYLISASGNFHALNKDTFDQKPFFSLQDINVNAIKLTAVALHPNFSIRDQVGFHVFYTAHIEPTVKNKRTNRIKGSQTEVLFDLVINEWQMLKGNTVDKDSLREVIRIGVPSESAHVTQLAFSPFKKSWNDDFGLLFIALTQDPQHNKVPLYSGAILRINPEKFGLRNYTIPNNNPFINQDDINNELFIIGVQALDQFIWPRKVDSSFLLSHEYNNERLLTIASPKDDYRQISPTNSLLKHTEPVKNHGLIAYNGRLLMHLWGSTVFLSEEDGNWQLQSLVITDHSDQTRAPVVEWQYQPENLNDKGPLVIFQDAANEILVLNQTNHQLSKLTLPLLENNTPNETLNMDSENEKSYINLIYLLAILIIIIAMLWMITIFLKKKTSSRHILAHQYSAIKFSESKEHISLFKYHQKKADVVLNVSDIVESNIILNDAIFNTIDHEHLFSNNAEKDLREQFNNERLNKMVSDRIRQLNIKFISKNEHEYAVCIYLRKGDNRITRKKFGDSVEYAIDWCWTVSKSISPTKTEQRNKRPEQREEMLKAPLHQQLMQTKTDPAQPLNPEPKVASSSDNHNSAQKSELSKKIPQDPLPTNHHDTTINTELVDALEKLANLKQRGALTEQEFELAKQKVLQGLLK
ncbi:SHOCT domain-containing protein [Thalassotalea atypica]|uniref:SHOCT domain-containing protein n=1 Tax=Thalassotalea atypica TaxID=2054316 RepID=UPI0025734A5F|nr:SHOCT domain-containing protein [Thalassotalea atypica]